MSGQQKEAEYAWAGGKEVGVRIGWRKYLYECTPFLVCKPVYSGRHPYWGFYDNRKLVQNQLQYRAGLSNIVVSYNPTDPCPKLPTQKIFRDF